MTNQRILKSLHIGVGNRGMWPIRLATPEQGYQPIGLCDPNADFLSVAQEFCRLPKTSCFRDLDAALAESEADCAIICAPTHFHLPLVKKCVEAGLDVLVEKGMASSWDEACEIVQIVERRGAKVAVAQNFRYRAAERTIAELLASGKNRPRIGKPFLVVYEENRVRPVPNNLTYPFASVWDMSCHHFDNLFFWFGPAVSLTAQAWSAPWSRYPHPNNTSAHIVFRDGLRVVYLHTHDASRASLHFEVHGDGGALVWNGKMMTVSERPDHNFGANPDLPVPLTEAPGENGILRDFQRYVCENIEPGISARNNLEIMAMCQMMVLSIEQRREVFRHELSREAAVGL